MNPAICPTCQLPIPPTAPGGFCPVCVLRDAEDGPTSGRPTPPLAEVAAAFPQLEILALIGQGGMGSVFKVRQPGLDRFAALKILCPGLGLDPAFAERFAREARVLAKLNHPNIVTVFEHGESSGFFYLLMEFVDGVNLRQAMRAGRFTPEQALAVVPGICDALQAAHAEGIWHRDIKPENILLDAQGEVKIVDFGIARLVGDPARDFTLTLTGAALGSAPYMAPEQHEKPHQVDHRADIYSLGVVIYEMLTGELPLGRFPAPSQRAAVSARIDEIVFQTLEKERELRQQSANEVKTDVHRATRPEVGVPAPHARPDASRKGMAALAFGMFLVATVVTPVLWLFFTRNEVVFIGLLSLLSALGLALMSWREPLGKFVTIATGALLVIAAAGLLWRLNAVNDAAARENQRVAALEAPTPPKPVATAPPAAMAPPGVPSPRPRAVPPPNLGAPAEAPKHAGLTAGEFVRLLNKLANESNGGEFGSLMPNLREDAIQIMPAFLGEIVGLRKDSRFSVRDGGSQFIAEMKRHDGVTEYQGIILLKSRALTNGKYWSAYYLGGVYTVPFRATCRIEFRPKNGDAMTILRTQLGNEDFMAVADAEGQYDICGHDTRSPQDAVEYANETTARLQASLRKFGLDATFRIIKPAEAPTSRWPGDDLPAVEYDFSTPPDAVASLIKAAKLKDVENFKRGISARLLAMTLAECPDFAEPMRDWEQQSYARGSQNGDAATVRVTNKAKNTTNEHRMVRENAEWKLDLPDRPEAPRQPRTPAARPTPTPFPAPEPEPTAEEVFRKMVAAANAADGEEFVKHEYQSSISLGDPPPVASRMAPFFGEILLVKQLPPGRNESKGTARLIARMKAKDGGTVYREFRFATQDGRRKFLTDVLPKYRATCRIEFRPDQGKAESILKLHLGETPFTAVPGADGKFDIGGETFSADDAARTADRNADQLLESLKKAGLDSFFKIIQRAQTPATPWLGEDSSPAERPAP